MPTEYIVNEKSSALITAVLKDENGNALGVGSITTLKATLYDLTTGSIINNRDKQDIKNTNGGEVDANGNFKLHLSPDDNSLVDATIIGREPHVLIVEWTYSSKTGKEVFNINVENLSRYTATIGAHTFLNYMDEVKLKVSDDAGKLTFSAYVSALHGAVTQYGKDKPFKARKRVQGNNSSLYGLADILGDDYVPGFTTVVEVEYPAGNTPRTIMEQGDWEIFDDGTAQDGSNLKLHLLFATPSTSEYLIVEYGIQPKLYEKPVNNKHQNFPDTAEHFNNITTLAAANCCLQLAAAYAPSSDATISADVVNHHDKSRKYSELARNYFKRYSQMVFGDEEPDTQVQAAYVDADADTTSMLRGDYLFHQRRGRVL